MNTDSEWYLFDGVVDELVREARPRLGGADALVAVHAVPGEPPQREHPQRVVHALLALLAHTLTMQIIIGWFRKHRKLHKCESSITCPVVYSSKVQTHSNSTQVNILGSTFV